MTKRKSTKRALLMSALSLLMCVSMLVGSTFAWFTDSVTSAGNIIQSGTLDVEMNWAKGNEDPNADTTAWTDASTGAIFDYDLWEPGYTEVRHIQINNAGTLALKYQLNIAANGEVSKLTDVIDVYYLDPAQQVNLRTDLTEDMKLGTLTQVLANINTTASGNLKAGESHTITIALKMQETAGNEYQGLSIGSDFSIVLMATQDNVEKDSFDENYDDIEIPEMSIQTINGVTYGTTINGDYVMISVDDYTLTTFAVDDAVTILGTGNGVNDNDRVFGKNAPLTSLTLNEGLVEIKDNALNALPNLATVNLPSTLKTIGIQAFRQTGMTELTIPESVETVKLGAFRDMANLTTVTVEGNVAFDNYAFRSCPKLETIYLLGDDVTFSGSQFATHDDNGACTSAAHKDNCPGKITIYVKNATVAARVIAAQGTSTCYEVKILGDAADGSDATDVEKVTNNTQLGEAIADGASTVILGSGTYTIPSAVAGKNVTLSGAGDTTVIDFSNTAANVGDASVTFENLKIVGKNSNTMNGYGVQHTTGDIVYKNCTFENAITSEFYGNVAYYDCKFVGTYYVATYAVESAIFERCVFDRTDSRALLVYSHGNNPVEVTVKDCEFKAAAKGYTWVPEWTAAVEVDTTNIPSAGTTVTIEGCTYDENYNGIVRDKSTAGKETAVITVDGVVVDNTTIKTTGYAG